MATPTGALPAPKSGFLTVQFWLGLITVVATFLLKQFGQQLGINIDTSFLTNLPDWLKGNIVPGVIGVGVVTAFIVISSWIETRNVRTRGTAPGAQPATTTRKGGKVFFETSEFWLGLVTVVLSYLEDNHVIDAANPFHASTGTTTLVLALIYTFARAQLKQAYAAAQANHS